MRLKFFVRLLRWVRELRGLGSVPEAGVPKAKMKRTGTPVVAKPLGVIDAHGNLVTCWPPLDEDSSGSPPIGPG